FAGVRYIRFQTVEGGVLLQRVGSQVEQPGAHHRTVPPDLRNLLEVEPKDGLRVHDREALGIGLHYAVLDAVVDHLDEVSGTRRTHAAPSGVRRRRERLEDRAQAFDDILVAADHHAVTLGDAPDAARRADIEKLKAFRLQGVVTLLRVFVIRVAAVDKDVALLHQGFQLGNGFVHRVAGGHHDPDRARGLQVLDQIFERIDAQR